MLILAYKTYRIVNGFFSCKWNRLKFACCKVKYGKQMRVKGFVDLRVTHDSIFEIGDNFTLYSGSQYNPINKTIKSAIVTESKSNLYIGNNVGMSSICIWVHNKVIIGNNVKIGADCIIIDSDCHSLDYRYRRTIVEDSDHSKSLPVIIGNDVLIGARCIILKGSKIGNRSIIGAGSVVSGQIPEDEIWAGNPARFIKRINK